MSRKTVVTQTIYGEIPVKVTARKWLAVNRNEDDYWVVTHIPSGKKAPGYFLNKKDAIAASKLARRVFPYPLRIETAPTQKQWFNELSQNQIKFVN